MYAMCPFRPTAIATPGATPSSIATLTFLSSLPASAVSSPELLRPSSGATYLIGGGTGAAVTRAWGGAAQPARAAIAKTAKAFKDFMSTSVGYNWAAATLRGADDLHQQDDCTSPAQLRILKFAARLRLAPRRADAVPDDVTGGDGISARGEDRTGRRNRARQGSMLVRPNGT